MARRLLRRPPRSFPSLDQRNPHGSVADNVYYWNSVFSNAFHSIVKNGAILVGLAILILLTELFISPNSVFQLIILAVLLSLGLYPAIVILDSAFIFIWFGPLRFFAWLVYKKKQASR